MKKGEFFEKENSKKIFKNEFPFLISSLVLRENSLGQIDFAKLYKKEKNYIYEIWEIKSKSYPSKTQRNRLIKAQDYLSRVLESEVHLVFRLCQKTNDSLF